MWLFELNLLITFLHREPELICLLLSVKIVTFRILISSLKNTTLTKTTECAD